jgi:hypothetical protein
MSKNYTIAICRISDEHIERVSWHEFGKTLRQLKCSEAIIYVVDEYLTEESLILRQVISEQILNEQRVRHLSEYILISHADGYRAMPCIVLLDAEVNYFIRGILLASKHRNHIDVRFRPDGSISATECDFVISDFFSWNLRN